MELFGWVSFLAAIMVIGPIIRGWVLATLWGWFMVPTFGAPTLSIPVAIGIATIVGLLTYHYDGKKKNEPVSTVDAVSTAITLAVCSPLLTLAIGWVVYLFV